MVFRMLAHLGCNLVCYKCRCWGVHEAPGCWIQFQSPVHAEDGRSLLFLWVCPQIKKNLCYSPFWASVELFYNITEKNGTGIGKDGSGIETDKHRGRLASWNSAWLELHMCSFSQNTPSNLSPPTLIKYWGQSSSNKAAGHRGISNSLATSSNS